MRFNRKSVVIFGLAFGTPRFKGAYSHKDQGGRGRETQSSCHFWINFDLKEKWTEERRRIKNERRQEAQTPGNHLFGSFNLEKPEKVVPPHAREGRSPNAKESPFRQF